MADFIQHAQEYIKKGYLILPVWGANKKDNDQKATFISWTADTLLNTEDDLAQWYAISKAKGIALAYGCNVNDPNKPGKRMKGVWGIDSDGDSCYDMLCTLDTLPQTKLLTQTVNHGVNGRREGWHYGYPNGVKHEDLLVSKYKNFKDLLGIPDMDGGIRLYTSYQVVGPTKALNSEGNLKPYVTYDVEKVDGSLTDRKDLEDIHPNAVIEELQRRYGRKNQHKVPSNYNIDYTSSKSARINLFDVVETNRRDHLVDMIGSLKGLMFTDEVIRELIHIIRPTYLVGADTPGNEGLHRKEVDALLDHTLKHFEGPEHSTVKIRVSRTLGYRPMTKEDLLGDSYEALPKIGDDLLDLDNNFGELLRLGKKIDPNVSTEFIIGTVLSAVSATLGSPFCHYSRRLSLNTNFTLISESGEGKGVMKDYHKILTDAFGLDLASAGDYQKQEFYGIYKPNFFREFSDPAAVNNNIATEWNVGLRRDEFGVDKEVLRKNPNHRMHGLVGQLNEFLTTDSPDPKAYTNSKDIIAFDHPFSLNLIWFGTLTNTFPNYTKSDSENGDLARQCNFFMETPEDEEFENTNLEKAKLPKRLINKVHKKLKQTIKTKQGVDWDKYQINGSADVIEFNKEKEKEYKKAKKFYLHQRDDRAMSSIMNRAYVKTLVYQSLFYLLDSIEKDELAKGRASTIQLKHAELAVRIAEYNNKIAAYALRNWITYTDLAQSKKKVIAFMKKMLLSNINHVSLKTLIEGPLNDIHSNGKQKEVLFSLVETNEISQNEEGRYYLQIKEDK